MCLKKIIAVLCAGLACLAGAQTPWLTVVGDAADPAVDTIEVDPVAVAIDGPARTMRVRVSRAQERTSTDGIVFMSYRSVVLFDCDKRSARFLSADFFRAPLWRGEAHESIVYASNLVRPVVFRGIEPNPLQRIIRAACQSPSGDKK